MGYRDDVYSSPKAFGLTLIDSIDGGADWEFNMVAAWKHDESGKVYWARDSGCSCPSPFEDFYDLNDLTLLIPDGLPILERAMRESDASLDDRTSMFTKIEAAMKEA